jgi:hypothetical protein
MEKFHGGYIPAIRLRPTRMNKNCNEVARNCWGSEDSSRNAWNHPGLPNSSKGISGLGVGHSVASRLIIGIRVSQSVDCHPASSCPNPPPPIL